MAGMIGPSGKAEPVDGGYRVTGRWAFGSGIHHADWVIAGAFLPDQPLPAGIRMVLLPREQVVIHDNWQVAGLKATGSCDYSIENVFVPDEMTFPFMDAILGRAVTGGAALRLGLPALVIPFHMAIALGIARRALDEITEQAVEKGRGNPPSPLPTHPHFQFAVGKAALQLASARALAFQVLSSVWTEARAGRVPPRPLQAEARAAAVYITEVLTGFGDLELKDILAASRSARLWSSSVSISIPAKRQASPSPTASGVGTVPARSEYAKNASGPRRRSGPTCWRTTSLRLRGRAGTRSCCGSSWAS